MIRPVKFGFNEQTAASNSFQQNVVESDASIIQRQALQEFDDLSNKLKVAGIDLVVFEDTISPATPDSIFPNNWISFHESKELVLYSMLAKNRRLERRDDIINKFKRQYPTVIDLSQFENMNLFLEGTGSIVFDYGHKTAYANISPRTNKQLFEQLCKQLGYAPVSFYAVDEKGADIYHTNVLMCIGSGFAVICEECIPEQGERKTLIDSLKSTGHEIISISYAQMNSFAGNMYQVFNSKGDSFIVMSEQAFKSLLPAQITVLQQYGNLLHSPLYTIEKHGGGSARCMIAEIR